jgi:hypothetical protein
MLLTRTTAHGRVHVNAHARIGDGGSVTDVPRWAAGAALDRPLALRSMLIAAEVTVEEPESGLDIVWRSAAGARVQLTPRVVIDAGLARTHSGDARGWRITGGSAIAFAIPGLQMRGAR